MRLLSMTRLWIACFFFAAVSPWISQAAPTKVLDLNSEAIDKSSTPRRFLQSDTGDVVFFAASDPRAGEELWRSDGTKDGTYRVADICPGPCSSEPWLLGTASGRTFLIADDGSFGHELWSTDGTREGTVRVRDICPGACSGGRTGRNLEAVVFQDRLVFSALGANGSLAGELWITDGTREGTTLLDPQCSAPCASEPRSLRATDTQIFFRSGHEIYRADGSSGGTRALFDIGTGTVDTAILGEDLVLEWWTPATGTELWRTDGSTDGPTLVVDNCPGPCRGVLFIHGVVGDQLYFSDDAGLYRTDGTAAGTKPTTISRPRETEIVGETLFALSVGDSRGYELWKVDNTSTQARFVKDIGPGGISADIGSLFASGDLLYFREGPFKNRLWSSDGTAAGTQQVFAFAQSDGIFVDGANRYRVFGALAGDRAVFAADVDNGFELWTSDGTSSGTRQTRNLSTDPGSARPSHLAAIDERLVFSAIGANADAGIWSTDGLAAGTSRLNDGPQRPEDFFRVGDELIYSTSELSAEPHDSIAGLWATDGMSTRQVAQDLRAAAPIVALPNGELLLETTTEELYYSLARELWTTDLTEVGTQFLAELTPGVGNLQSPPIPISHFSAHVTDPALLPERLVFAGGSAGRASPLATAISLWATDGTAEGTVEILPSASPRGMTRLQDFAIFSASDSQHGREVWRTNGTKSETFLLVDLALGAASSSPHDFNAVNPQTALFFATQPGGGEALWRSDGTAAGTVLVTGLEQHGQPSFVLDSELVLDRVFFTLANDQSGTELWVTDGTAAGTLQVRELVAGRGSAQPRELTAFEDLLLFTARDFETGQELWATDGTPEGTHRLTDIAAGPEPSGPANLHTAGSRVFFSADDGTSGRELWSISFDEIRALFPEASGPEVFLLEERFKITADWTDFEGNSGTALARKLTDKTGTFWFFAEDNLELFIKVLDGCGFNGHQWILLSGLTNVGVDIRVEDTVTGQVKNYSNSEGDDFRPIFDTSAFAACETEASTTAASGSPSQHIKVISGPTVLLRQGRFEISAQFTDFELTVGTAQGKGLSDKTGTFWFFDEENLEIFIKVLDGCEFNNRQWVLISALTNVGVEVRVTDTSTGEQKLYTNDLGNDFQPIFDIEAFDTCAP